MTDEPVPQLTTAADSRPAPDDAADVRRLLDRVAGLHQPSPVPLEAIARGSSALGRRRARFTGGVVTGVLLTAAALLPSVADRRADPAGPPSLPPLSSASSTSGRSDHRAESGPVVIGSGTVDGVRWSLSMRAAPTGSAPATTPTGSAGASQRPPDRCQLNLTVAGTPSTGPGTDGWTACPAQPAAGDGPVIGGDGAWGAILTPDAAALPGVRIWLGAPAGTAVRGVLALEDGSRPEAKVVEVPGAGRRTYAIALGKDQQLAAFEEYDAFGHVVARSAAWGAGRRPTP